MQLELAGSAKRWVEMARQTWRSAAGSANMEVSSAGEANRKPELSCKTCLKRTLKRALTFATPILMEIGRVGRRGLKQAVELYERKSELRYSNRCSIFILSFVLSQQWFKVLFIGGNIKRFVIGVGYHARFSSGKVADVFNLGIVNGNL